MRTEQCTSKLSVPISVFGTLKFSWGGGWDMACCQCGGCEWVWVSWCAQASNVFAAAVVVHLLTFHPSLSPTVPHPHSRSRMTYMTSRPHCRELYVIGAAMLHNNCREPDNEYSACPEPRSVFRQAMLPLRRHRPHSSRIPNPTPTRLQSKMLRAYASTFPPPTPAK